MPRPSAISSRPQSSNYRRVSTVRCRVGSDSSAPVTSSSRSSDGSNEALLMAACEAVEYSRTRRHVAPVIHQPTLRNDREPGRCDVTAAAPGELVGSGLERLGGDLLGEDRVTASVAHDAVDECVMLPEARREPTAGDVITGTHTGSSDHGTIPRRANREGLPSIRSDISRGPRECHSVGQLARSPRTDRSGRFGLACCALDSLRLTQCRRRPDVAVHT